LRRNIEAEISASRWDRAATLLAEFQRLDASSPDAPAWSRRIADGRARDGRLRELSTTIPAAITSGDWGGARSLLDQLASDAPKHPERERWESLVEDQLSVRALLADYRSAQAALDAEAYRRLWVDLSEQNLEKVRSSYGDMRAQELTIEGIVVEISGDTGSATFRERRSVSPRVGNKQTSEGVIALALSRTASGWRIASRTMQR
jgi:hypothetical protein